MARDLNISDNVAILGTHTIASNSSQKLMTAHNQVCRCMYSDLHWGANALELCVIRNNRIHRPLASCIIILRSPLNVNPDLCPHERDVWTSKSFLYHLYSRMLIVWNSVLSSLLR